MADIDVHALAAVMNKQMEREPLKLADNPVDHPAHYNKGDVECIDGIKAALGEHYIGFLIGNVIKYCWRYEHKNGVDDIKKARYYIDAAIKELEHAEQK